MAKKHHYCKIVLVNFLCMGERFHYKVLVTSAVVTTKADYYNSIPFISSP